MIKLLKIFPILCMLLFFPNLQGEDTKPIILAKVNGQTISEADLIERAYRIERRIREHYSKDKALLKIIENRQRTLKELIDDILIFDWIKVRKTQDDFRHEIKQDLQKQIKSISNGDESKFIKILEKNGLTLEKFKEDIYRRLAIAKVKYESVDLLNFVSEPAIKAYYNKNTDQFIIERKVRLAAIVVSGAGKSAEDFKNKIKEIQNLISKEEFSKIADKYSDLPSKGGDMGFKKLEELDELIQKAIENLKVGQISDPVTFNGNFAIFKILEIQKKSRMPLDNKLKNKIEYIIENRQRKQLYDKMITGVSKKAKIEIYADEKYWKEVTERLSKK